MASIEIRVPHGYEPRPYQLGLFRARERGVRRMCCVWHRRAGKDKTLLNLMVREMVQRVGSYYYYFPTAVWARKAIWDGMDKDGFRFREHFPVDLVAGVKDREMQVELVNGSVFQIVGTDTLDVVGVNPVGCVFSEYSLQNPKAWEYITPILLENDGWAAFNFTPRGKNHAHRLYEMASRSNNWYCELLTIRDTGVISEADVKREIAEGVISRELADQEYYCSFEYGMAGSVFGQYLKEARALMRIGRFPHDRERDVYTFWDLGVSDATSVWFGQLVSGGDDMEMVDYLSESNRGLDWFKERMDEKGYRYAAHFAPHDVAKRQMIDATSLVHSAMRIGLKFEIVPRTTSVEADIELVRRLLPRFRFDDTGCGSGLDSLADYHRDEETGKPVHDHSSHGVDAFRTACRAIDLGMVRSQERVLRMRQGETRRQETTGTLDRYDPLEDRMR